MARGSRRGDRVLVLKATVHLFRRKLGAVELTPTERLAVRIGLGHLLVTFKFLEDLVTNLTAIQIS